MVIHYFKKIDIPSEQYLSVRGTNLSEVFLHSLFESLL